jgi:EAL domain-containing protein (putative c-di-GMP-specific phosphodiesterase class I)
MSAADKIVTDAAANLPSLADLAKLLPQRCGAITYCSGARVFAESDAGQCAYLIETGYVEISRWVGGGKLVVATLGPGEIFGEMATIDGQVLSATAIALHETVLVPITQGQLDDAIQSENPLTQLLVRSMVRRLRTPVPTSPASATSQPAAREVEADTYFRLARDRAAEHVHQLVTLRDALDRRAFQLHYQPVVRLSDSRVEGFEALIRWPQEGGKMVSPDEFIPLAEISGLIVPLGEWVLETSIAAWVRMQRELSSAGRPSEACFISVNVSPAQLESEANVERLASLIEEGPMDPAYLKLEITERTLMTDPSRAMVALSRLRNTGARIAIDDFGTGYSSLSYLHKFPLNTLKIDRSFVNSMVGDINGERVVSAIISLAHELGMDVIAEGVEYDEELQKLRVKGCEYGQGYYFSKPVPLGAAIGKLSQRYL